MKKIILLFLTCFLSTSGLFAIRASVTYSTFKGQAANFVEIHLHVVGASVDFKPIDTLQMQAAVDVTLIFKKGEEIVKFDRFRLNSPLTPRAMDFIDLKRYELKNGSYNLEASFEDVNSPENKVSYDADFKVYFSKERVQQSDIQLVSVFRNAEPGEKNAFIKSGLYLENAAFNFYGKNAENLTYYNEIYNTEQKIGEDFMMSYIIEKLLGNDKKETVLIGHKRKKPEPVVVALQNIDIRELDSGNYNLIVEIRDRNKGLLSKKSLSFQRSNPRLNAEMEELAKNADVDLEFVADLTDQDLRYSLKALYPIMGAEDGEYINAIIANKKRRSMQEYLFGYWAQINPNNPKVPYEGYMKVARAVDKTYASGFGYGFESDRGYIFMKYGKPSDVVTVEDEPDAPPYEIWSYNDFPKTQQSNVKFLYYNPTLATGQFQLLHSTAKGEANNPRWEIQLYDFSTEDNAQNDYGRVSDAQYIKGSRQRNFSSRRARQLFEDF
ncbi:MAG: GWxTD domain-containing protein [Paraglaciecola sp.]|jgi:GWxTD domain-containing protein